MTARTRKGWWILGVLAATMWGGMTKVRAQDDEPHRYTTGEIKVGERVEANPFDIDKWYKGTVTKINYVQTDPGAIDTFKVKLDPAPGQAPMTYNIIADVGHVRPLKDKAVPAPPAQDPNGKDKPNGKPAAKPKPTKPVGTKPLVPGGPSEAQIKNAIHQWLEAADKQQDKNSTTTIDWDTAIRSAPAVHKTIHEMTAHTFYPVKVDYTVTTEHPTRFDVYHWKGGIYDFYQDDFGDWKFILDEQPTFTRDGAKSVTKDN